MKSKNIPAIEFSILNCSLALINLLLLLMLLPAEISAQPESSASAKGVTQSRLKKEHLSAEKDDLPSIKTTDLETGAKFRVYFDQISAKVAEESIPTLAAYYRQISDLTAVEAGKVNWHSVVFTQTADYKPPTREGEVRWVVQVDPSGQLSSHGTIDFYLVLPHEQVHAVQKQFIPIHAPRWFKEGQATWVGLKVTEKWNPQLALKERETLAKEQEKASEPLKLRQWGSVRVKGNSIARQLTPEQREKIKQNPGTEISGSFTFSQSDLISDESNAKARYGAALRIFEALEKNAADKMSALFKSVWDRNAELDTNTFIKLAQEQTNLDIAPLLN